MNTAIIILFNIVLGIGVLMLTTMSLAVIYGFMRIINLAHGEFMMLGAYSVWFSTSLGVNIWIAILIIAPLVVAIIGVIIERTIIRFLYGRIIDTMLATWGVSLLLIGGVTALFGNHVRGLSTPLGSFAIGDYGVSYYSLALVVISFVSLFGLWAIFRFTRFGLIVRATMLRPEMAAALGINRDRVYVMTFALGAGLAGLAGGVIAPLAGVFPSMGMVYIIKAFIAVLIGGPAAITGITIASSLLAPVSVVGSFLASSVVGEIALLTLAIVLIRLLPMGITGKWPRLSL